ncbi:putative exonuclease [Pseudomonas phage 16Q]|nr:putative exonuclease [Pseudomonas phage 16Q]
MSEDILVFDADSIAYKAAAANETKTICTQHIEKGVIEHWDNRTAFRAFLKDTPHTEDMYTITDFQEARHSSYGKSLIREMIKGHQTRLGVSNNEIYIGGVDNFRDRIPLPMTHIATVGKWAGQSKLGGKYKENRDGNIRPLQLKELRAYMIGELKAIVVNGQEVDDVGSIRAYDGHLSKTRIIQVTEDKDALQCTGWLFNPQKMTKPVYIKGFGELHKEGKGIKGTGRLWLYYQTLYGDSVDNYHGCDLWKIQQDKAGKSVTFGEVAAYNILKDCKNDKEAVKALYSQYLSWYPEPVVYMDHTGQMQQKDAVEIMQMYFDAAHMRRWKDDRIIVEDLLDKLGVIK